MKGRTRLSKVGKVERDDCGWKFREKDMKGKVSPEVRRKERERQMRGTFGEGKETLDYRVRLEGL